MDYAFRYYLLDQICSSERSELAPQKMIFTCMIKDTCYNVNKDKGNYNNHHFVLVVVTGIRSFRITPRFHY